MTTIPSTKEQERLHYIMGRLATMSEHKARYSQYWEDYERLWKRNRVDHKGKDVWRANTVDANVRAIVDTAHSAIVATSPYPNFIAQQQKDRTKEALVNQIYKFNHWKSNQELEFYYIYLDALKLGKGFGKVTYLRDEREVQFPISVDPETLAIEYEQRKIFDFDDVKTVRVSAHRMFVDEMAPNLAAARDVIEEEVISKEEFDRIYGPKYPNAKKVKSAGDFRAADVSRTGTISPSPKGGTTENDNIFTLPDSITGEQVQILHYYSRPQDRYEIVANGVVLTHGQPIPYQHKQLPFFEVPYSPDSGDEFWGPGIPSLIRRDVEELRKIRNMRIDRAKLKIFAPGLYSGLLEEFSEQLVELQPMTWIPVNDPKNFSRIDVGEIGVEAYKEDELIEEDIRKVTGIDERILGLSPENRTLTATEVRFLRESALRRLSRFLFLVRKVGLEREARLKLSMFKQFYEPSRIMKIVENAANVLGESVELKKSESAEVFTGDFDGRIDPMNLVPKSMAEEQVKWATALQVIMPLAQSGKYDIIKTVDNYLTALEIDPERIKSDSEEGDVRVAREENGLFIDGREVPDTPIQFVSPAHTREHLLMLRKEVDLPKDIRELVKKHIEAELKLPSNPQGDAAEQAQSVAEGAARIPSIIQQTGQPEIQQAFSAAEGEPLQQGDIVQRGQILQRGKILQQQQQAPPQQPQPPQPQ